MAGLGYDVVLTARDEQRLEAVARHVEGTGGRALVVASDLTDRDSIIDFADAAEAWGEGCDVLCNIGVYQGPGAQQLLTETAIEVGWRLAYAAGKAGIEQFAKALNVELNAAGIRAFTVEPGFLSPMATPSMR